MRALVYTSLRTLEVREVSEASLAVDEVKVRVRTTGICGSDIHGFLGHQARRQPGLVLGHETTGIVIDGDDSIRGQRVSVNPLITCRVCPACRAGRQNHCAKWRLLGMDQTNGGFGETVVVPKLNVHPIPDSVSDSAAVMVEPLANAFHILSMIPVGAGLTPPVAIIGGGTLGACILAVALTRGLNVVAVSEPNPKRAEVARRLGAKTVIDPRSSDLMAAVLAATDGVGVAASVDAVGNQQTRKTAADIVQRGGTALLLGLDEGATTLDFSDLIRREVRLQTSFAYTDQNFAEALSFVMGGAVDFSPWTDVVPLEQGQSAFERLISDPGDRIKIALAL